MTDFIFRFVSFTYAGSSFGTVISMPLSGYLCDALGWESVFYVFGALGLVSGGHVTSLIFHCVINITCLLYDIFVTIMP